MSQHSLKSCLLAAIEGAYRAVDARLQSDFSLKVHDLRKLSFSLASGAGVSLETIMVAGRWKHRTLFRLFFPVMSFGFR
jgi:hypothetical protein